MAMLELVSSLNRMRSSYKKSEITNVNVCGTSVSIYISIDQHDVMFELPSPDLALSLYNKILAEIKIEHDTSIDVDTVQVSE
jgi:hypothetical protein